MVLRPTDGVLTASSVDAARVLTPLVDAGHGVAAGVIGSTGINALAVLANLPRSAVDILQTDGHHGDAAEGVGVAGVARRTGAPRPVSNRTADGIDAAGLRVVTGVDALLRQTGHIVRTGVIVATAHCAGIFFADLSQLTLAVLGALQQRQSGGRFAVVKGVALKTGRAAALRSMEHWLTLGVETTGRLGAAGVDALAVVAGTVKGAVIVGATAADALALVADVARVAGVVVEALLHHLHAVVGVADLPRTAVTVHSALHLKGALILLAVNLRIADVVWRTLTFGLMVQRLAEGAKTTGARNRTRVGTLSVETGLFKGTVGV